MPRTTHLILGLLVSSVVCATPSLANTLRFVDACPKPDGELVVSFLNVGQGDATLIQCPDGRTQALIDAADSNEAYPGAEKLLLEGLSRRMKSDKIIETALATHPHRDHIYGFGNTLPENGYSIKNYYDAGADNPNSSLEETIRNSIKEQGGSYVNLNKTGLKSINICPNSGIRLQVLQHKDQENAALQCPQQLNDCSVVSRLDHKGVSFLFMADSLKKREAVLLQNPEHRKFLANVDVLTSGHHGSRSTSEDLLKLSAPKIVLLSTGKAGLGTTGVYDFPEHSVLQEIARWFSGSNALASPTGAGKTPKMIPGCHRAEGACRWKPSELPWNAWSTAVSGSLDVLVQNNFMCVSSDLRTISIEFSF